MDLKILKDTPPWGWPENDGKLFLNTLRDPKAAPSDRLLAAELAGDYTVINDELARALLTTVAETRQPEDHCGRAKTVIPWELSYTQSHGNLRITLKTLSMEERWNESLWKPRLFTPNSWSS
jgi:hypothetical protein